MFEPALTPDKEAAYFGRNADRYVVWSEGEGPSTRPVKGLPDSGKGAGHPLLAADGFLRLVVGRRTSSG